MIYFITEKYLKENTPIANNVDMSKIDYLSRVAYDIVIVPLLGFHFAEWLLAKHQEVIIGTYTYNSFEERLVDLIQNTIAWNVAYDAVYDLSSQLQNKGLLSQSGDYQNYAGDSQVKYMAQRYKDNVEAYKLRLNTYLCNNANEFNEFIIDTNTDSLIKEHCTKCCNGNLDDLQDYGMFFV